MTIASSGEIAIGTVSGGQYAGLDNLGTPGVITISSINGPISTGDLDVSSIAQFGNPGIGGNLTVSSVNGSITTGRLDAQAGGGGGGGSGGNIFLSTIQGNLTTGDVTAESSGYVGNADGNGGTIVLTSRDGSVTTGTLIARSTTSYFSTGNAGRITVSAGGDLRTDTISNYALTFLLGILDPPIVDPDNPITNVTGQGGAIDLTSTGGSIQTGDLFSFSTAAFDPGYTWQGAPEDLQRVNQFFRANAHDVGGNIRLSAAQNLTTGLVSTISSSGSGSIDLSAGNTLSATGKIISSDTFGVGKAGNITLTAQTVLLKDGAQLSASTHGAGTGGNITIVASQGLELGGASTQPPTTTLSIQTPIGLTVIPDVYLGGYLPTGDVDNIPDAGAFPSGIFVQNTANSTGDAGNINIQAGQLTLSDQGTIAATTFGSGNGGNVSVNAGSIRLDNGSIFSGVAPGSGGDSGTIALTTQSLNITNQGRVQAQTLGRGRAGDMQIQAETVTIAGSGSGITSGSGDSEQRGGAIGAGGNIRLNTNSLQIEAGGLISAATYTEGQGGTIDITANQVDLLSQGKLSATTQGRGLAGSITVTARDQVVISGDLSGIVSGSGDPGYRGGPVGPGGNIRLNTDRLKISDSGIISASTFTQGQGGTIEITANQVDLLSQGRLSATTQDQGLAGNVTVNARDGVTIDGSLSGLFANTTPQSSGNGGSIFLTTAALRLDNNARITVESQGQGSGGDIQLSVNRLDLDNGGRIVAETASTQGGNIQIQARDLTLLRRGSLISATAGTAQAGGNGGNITIATPQGFVVGVLAENSDIRANAFTGNGGQVNITAQGIFGLTLQPRDTPNSDITASSQFGINGTVTLNTLNIDPNRGLVALPSGFSDANQVAQTCSAQQGGNSFVVTGRGGLSPDPSEAVTQTQLWTDGAPAQARSTPVSQSPPTLVEATSLQKNSDGSTSLVAPGETVSTALRPNCQTLAVYTHLLPQP